MPEQETELSVVEPVGNRLHRRLPRKKGALNLTADGEAEESPTEP
jgi:hypothetical protein